MIGWFFVPFVVAILTYWCASYWAARLLPNERRRLGDTRLVPDLLDPLTSHRWLPILLGEKTREFRPQARRAFTVARIALFLTPVAFVTSIVLVANVPDASGDQTEGEQGAPPIGQAPYSRLMSANHPQRKFRTSVPRLRRAPTITGLSGTGRAGRRCAAVDEAENYFASVALVS